MAHVDDLTFINAAQLLGSDELYIGRPSDTADPDKRTDLDELISRLLGADAAGISPFYAVGNFTPTLLTSSGSISATYVTREGRWRRVGALVAVQWSVAVSAWSGAGGTMRINGLPFTPRHVHGEGTARLSGVTFDSGRTAAISVALQSTDEAQINAYGSNVTNVALMTDKFAQNFSWAGSVIYETIL